MNLKQQALLILAAVSAAAGPLARAAISMAIWAVNKFVPDSAQAVTIRSTANAAAAPDVVKSAIAEVFTRLVALIPGEFARQLVTAAGNIVIGRYLDTAWDALVGKTTPIATAPHADAETEDILAACCG